MDTATETPDFSGLPLYQSHKTVRAAVITEIVDTRLRLVSETAAMVVTVDPAMFARYTPNLGDYFVVYADGYTSISPKAAFEEGYTLAPELPNDPAPAPAPNPAPNTDGALGAGEDQKTPAVNFVPTIGRIVHYRLNEDQAKEINAARKAKMAAGDYNVGNEVTEGQYVPAMIVAVFGNMPTSACNLVTFLDGPAPYWVTSRSFGDEAGTWIWPPRS